MILKEGAINKFKQKYAAYYGMEPIITDVGNEYYIMGIPQKISIPTMKQLSLFYNYRVNNNKTPHDEVTVEDFYMLDGWIENKWVSRLSVAMMLGVSAYVFQGYFKDCISVEQAYRQSIKHNGKGAEDITWEGVTKHSSEWAKDLGMTTSAFRHRRRIHGIVPLLFMSTEDYTNTPKPSVDRTPKKKKAFVPKDIPDPRPLINSKRFDANEYTASCNLIAELIQDSKDNLVTGITNDLSATFFRDSQRFLLNKNGQLSYFLETIPTIAMKESLKELREFATVDYKLLQTESTLKNQEIYENNRPLRIEVNDRRKSERDTT